MKIESTLRETQLNKSKNRDEPFSLKRFRLSIIHFLFGKGGSSIIYMLIFILLARGLSAKEYGAYTMQIAFIDIAMVSGGFGLDWVALRYLPEFRLHGSGKAIKRFIINLMSLRLMIQLIIAIAAMLSSDWLASWMGVEQFRGVLLIYCLILTVEGLASYIRYNIFGALMLQGYAQISQLAGGLVFLCAVGWMMFVSGRIDLLCVAWACLTATIIGCLLAFVFLSRLINQFEVDLDGDSTWQPPSFVACWRIAMHMYVPGLLYMLSGPNVMAFIISRWLGLESVGLYGFLRDLSGILHRNLPAELFFPIIRTKLVANFAANHDLQQTSRYSSMILTSNYLVLVPALAFIAVTGDTLPYLISNGKYDQSGYLLIGMILISFPAINQRVIEIVAVTLNRSDICFRTSFLSPVIVILATVLLMAGVGLWSVLISRMSGLILINLISIWGLRAEGYKHKLPWRCLFVLSFACLSGWAVMETMSMHLDGWANIVIRGGGTLLVIMLVVGVINPFTAYERNILRRFGRIG